MPQLGRLIEDKYEVLAKLREGGMGAIYQVRHRLLDEIRIVKVMRQGAEGDEELRKRFLEEAKTATRLKHPNICTIYDFAMDDDGTAYLVMEFIDGVTLGDLLKTRGSPGLGLSLRIAGQGLRALGYLHRKNVVHRDIAPDNLMLTSDDEGGTVIKLIDLGIAKVLDRKQEMTSSGVFLGKVRYASPEQFGTLAKGEMIDGRSDLYSLGLVLYELLTGQRALLGETPVELMRAHVFGEPVPFAESDPSGEVPEVVREIVFKALRKRREDRYQTAGEFAREIDAALASLATDLDLDSGQELINTVRLKRRPAADPVTPGAQEMLNRPFLGQVTPAPSSGLELVSDTIRHTAFLKEVAAFEERNDMSGLERLLFQHQKDPDLASAVQGAIDGLQRKLEKERTGEESDWTKALQDYSEEHWTRYLERHAGSKRSDEARARLSELRGYREARVHDSLPSWESFLSKWPKGHFRQEAEDRLARLREEIEAQEEANAWQRAQSEGSETAWRGFMSSYPRSARRQEAGNRLEELADFQKAQKADSIKGWEAFLSRWPQGAQRSKANSRLRLRREGAAFDAAEESAKASIWREFLRDFPQSSLGAVARSRLEEREAFESASQADSEAGWEQYLGAYGREAGAEQARGRLARVQARDQEAYERAVAASSADALRRYLSDRPSAKNRAAAEALLAETSAFETAGSEGVEGLEKFLKSYPQSRYRARAEARRKELQAEATRRLQEQERNQEQNDWRVAEEASSEKAWLSFLERWPKSQRRPEAQARLAALREQTAYKKVLATDSWTACREFLEQFPKSAKAQEVRDLLEERRAFEAASRVNTPAGWSDFLDRFPGSPRAALARQNQEALRSEETRALTSAISTRSVEALERFLAGAHEAENRGKAEALLADARAYEEARPGGGPALEKYLGKYPDGLHAAEARRAVEEIRQKALIEQIAAAEKADQTEVLQKLAGEAGSPRPVAEAARSALERLEERRRLAREAGDWQIALGKNTSESWETFLSAHGRSDRAGEARRMLGAAQKREAEERRRAAEEEKSWQRAVKSGKEKDWERFLAAHSSSPRAEEAREVLARLRVERAPAPQPTPAPEVPAVSEPRLEPSPEAVAPQERPGARWGLRLGLAAGVVALIAAAIVVLPHLRKPAPAPSGWLAVDSVPWARIIAIRDVAGKDVLAGAKAETPASFQLPPGRYQVLLANPDGAGGEMTLAVEVSADKRTVSTNRFSPIDAASYLAEEGWAK